jgi:hypothetical protein
MTTCEEVVKGYLPSNEIRGLKAAQLLGKWQEINAVASHPIWGSLACGKNYYLNSHTDDDFFYSLTTIASEGGLCQNIDRYKMHTEVCNYFTFAEHGIAVALRPGNMLIFNPLYHHCLSSRTSLYESNTILERRLGAGTITLTMRTHCQKPKDSLKLGLVNVIVGICNGYFGLAALRTVLIIAPIYEILWHIAKQKKVTHAILHNARQPGMKALEGTTSKYTMRITTIIKVEEGRHDRNLRDLLKLGASHPHIPFGTCIQHLNLLTHYCLYVLHYNELTIGVDVIRFALW